MKKIVNIASSSLLVLSLFIVAPVVSAATTNTTTPSSTQNSESADTAEKTPAERVAAYKTKLAPKLTATQEASLKIKCKPSQGISKVLAAKVVAGDTARVKVYEDITKKLTAITTGLKDADIDTKELVTQQANLAELITTYKKSVKEYTTTLADLNQLDCVADLVGYKATLETARTSRAVVAKDALAVRTYVTDTIKPALKAAQASLTNDATDKQGDE